MALSMFTNSTSLFTQSSLLKNQNALATSQTRLGTGLRINSSKDDAAGLQIATRLNSEARGMASATKNANNAISILQTADSAFNEVTSILQRMKDLGTEGKGATTTVADKAAMQAEFDELGKEISSILNNTTFGGEALFRTVAGPSGKLGGGPMVFQIGAASASTLTVNVVTQLTAVTTALTALSAHTGFTAVTAAGAQITGTADVIGLATTALNNVATLRSSLGANINRLEHTINNLDNVRNNTEISKGRIMDTDFATESSAMTSKQMLMQSSTMMLKQANQMSGMAMSLLQ